MTYDIGGAKTTAVGTAPGTGGGTAPGTANISPPANTQALQITEFNPGSGQTQSGTTGQGGSTGQGTTTEPTVQNGPDQDVIANRDGLDPGTNANLDVTTGQEGQSDRGVNTGQDGQSDQGENVDQQVTTVDQTLPQNIPLVSSTARLRGQISDKFRKVY